MNFHFLFNTLRLIILIMAVFFMYKIILLYHQDLGDRGSNGCKMQRMDRIV